METPIQATNRAKQQYPNESVVVATDAKEFSSSGTSSNNLPLSKASIIGKSSQESVIPNSCVLNNESSNTTIATHKTLLDHVDDKMVMNIQPSPSFDGYYKTSIHSESFPLIKRRLNHGDIQEVQTPSEQNKRNTHAFTEESSNNLLDHFSCDNGEVNNFSKVPSGMLEFIQEVIPTEMLETNALKKNKSLTSSDYHNNRSEPLLAFLGMTADAFDRYEFPIRNTKYYDSVQDCISSLSIMRQQYAIVVLCGEFVTDTKVSKQLVSIRNVKYIFSLVSIEDEAGHASPYPDICVSITDLFQKINKRLHYSYQNVLPTGILFSEITERKNVLPDLSSEQTNFIGMKLFLEQILTMKETKFSKEVAIKFCRSYFSGNPRMLFEITRFETTYQKTDNILEWYKPNTFMYCIINEGMKKNNIETLFKLGYFLNELQSSINQLKLEPITSPIFWYGEMSFEDLDKIESAVSHLIVMNTFFCATTKPDMNRTTETYIQFHLECGMVKQYKERIIIPPNSIFYIKSLEKLENNLKVYLSLMTNDVGDILKNALSIEDSSSLAAIGNFFIATNQFEKAKFYCEQLALWFPSDIAIWNQVAYINIEIGNYAEATKIYRNCIKIQERILQGQLNQEEQLQTLIQLGGLNYNVGNNTKALYYLEQALRNSLRMVPSDKVAFATCSHFMGLVHKKMSNYDKAVEHAENALQFCLSSLPADHSFTAISCFNLGCILRHLGHYQSALAYFQLTLDISGQILSPQHPQFASIFHNLGLTNHQIGEYHSAVQYYEDALAILYCHRSIIDIQKFCNIYQLLEALRSEKMASPTLIRKASNIQQQCLTVLDIDTDQLLYTKHHKTELLHTDCAKSVLSTVSQSKSQKDHSMCRCGCTNACRCWDTMYDCGCEYTCECRRLKAPLTAPYNRLQEPFMAKTSMRVIAEALSIGRSTLWSPLNLESCSFGPASKSSIVNVGHLSTSIIDLLFQGGKKKSRKGEMNLEGCTLAWIDRNLDDPDIDKLLAKFHISKSMRDIINYVRGFKNVTEALQYISTAEDEHIFIVTTSEFAEEDFVIQLDELPQVKHIYVWDQNNLGVEFGFHSKIRGVFTVLPTLIMRLKSDVDSYDVNADILYNVLNSDQIERSLRNLTYESVTFMWYDIMIDILLRLERKDSFQDMIELFRSNYSNNEVQMRKVNEFEKTYKSENAALWYAKNTFVYRILNHALRTQNAATIYHIRHYICDLHNQLTKKHQEFIKNSTSESKPLTVYRGQKIKDTELKLCNPDALIAMNTFVSTSLYFQTADMFADNGEDSNFTAIVFQIEVDTKVDGVPYGIVNENINQESEREVLFSIGSTLRIKSVEEYEEVTKTLIELEYLSYTQNPVRDLKQRWKELLNLDRNPLPATAWATFLYTIGEFDSAKEYLLNLLKDGKIKDGPLSSIYTDLGMIYYEQEDYEKSLYYYKKARRIVEKHIKLSKTDTNYYKVFPQPHLLCRLASLCNDIGGVLFAMKKHDDASKLFKDALAIDRTCPCSELRETARTYNNIGLNNMETNENRAIACFEKAREICSSPISYNSTEDRNVTLAAIFNNIGVTHKSSGRHQQAIAAFKKSVAYAAKSLPESHPSLLVYQRNLADCSNNSFS